MNRSRWISLIVVALCVGAWLLPQAGPGGADEPGRDGSGHVKGAGVVCLFLGLVCVWWPDTLGDALWVGQGAWNPTPSSGGAVKLLGWLFLIAALLLCVAGDRLLAAAGLGN
ncbi:MAG: hypothetical protein JW741_21015 [Sedimentisphaerales bacterium]|nr:hypothetical protein [Sedimentisphaerales bacterium]